MRIVGWLALGSVAFGVPAMAAEPASRPIVVELFTSEGCSSCPPADALLTEIAGSRRDVLALAFHVTYWNSLGWRDPFSFDGATARQASYHGISSVGGSYTPQMVVDGTHDVVGSDRAGVQSALRAALPVASAPVRVSRDGEAVAVDIAAAAGVGRVWLVGYDAQHRTQVGRGENAGRTLLESNVVRSIEPLGNWTGAAASFHHAAPAGEHVAVLVQAADGRMLGAAVAQ